MSERLSKRLKRIFRSTLDLIGIHKEGGDKPEFIDSDESTANPESDSVSPNDGLLNEELLIDIDSLMAKKEIPTEEILIDIDSLMAEKEIPTEEEFIEVILIDVFKQNADQQIEDKLTVFRELLLSNKLDVLPDLSPLNLLTDEELDLLLKRCKPPTLLIISMVWPQLKTKICEVIANQNFLWFSANSSKARFAAHEDCCDLCDHILDISQSCVEVVDNRSLAPALAAFKDISLVFSSLKCLRLFRFVIDEESDQLIAEMCPNLVHLDLTECKITSWTQLSAQHKQIKHLILNSTAITDEIFEDIVRNKTNLKTIAVNNTNITGKGLSLLPIEIERLDIRCCGRLPNYNYMFLANRLKYLRIEVVFDDNIFDLMCSSLNNLILLEIMATNPNRMRVFTTEGLKHISKLSNLRSLKLGKNLAIRSIPLEDIFIGCPLMEAFSLDSSDCNVVIKEGMLTKISDYWPLLKRIEFKGVECITKDTIDGLTRLQFLSYLDLTDCTSVDDYCLINNIEKMSKLRYLVLDKCHRLTILTYNAVVEKARKMDSVLSASFFRCNFFVDYIKAEVLPRNLRLTFASTKSKRFMTFDGNRVKIFRCEQIHHYFNGK